jgi:hypothetical protein
MDGQAALRAAFKIANSATKLPFRRDRSPANINDDEKLCFQFSRHAGLDAFPQNRSCYIRYSDVYDEYTERDVKILGVFAFNGKRYIETYCEIRKDRRRFIYERIDLIECDGKIFHDARKNIFQLSELFEISIDYGTLAITDFFAHPRTWGDYRRPIAVLLAFLRASGCDEWSALEKVREFGLESFQSGTWAGWRTNQQARALGLLGITIDTKFMVPEFEYSQIRGGRFNRAAFDRACGV